MKMLIDVWVDGYDDPKQRKEACIEWVKTQLDTTATSVKILWIDKEEE